MSLNKKLMAPLILATLSFSSIADDFNKGYNEFSVGMRHGMNGVLVQGAEDSEQRVVNEGELQAGYKYVSKNIELLKESDVAIYVNIKTGAKLLIPIYASYGTETDDNCDCNLPNIGFDGLNADVTAKFGDISNGPVFTLKNNLKLFGRNHRFFSEERDGVGGTQSFQDKLLFGNPDQNSTSTEAELKHLLANPHQLVKSSHSGDTLTAGMATKLGDFMFEGYLKGGIEFASYNMIMPDSDFVIGSYGAGILLRLKDRRNKIGLDFEQMGNISNEDKLKMSQSKLELSLELKDMPRFYINNQKTSLALPQSDLPSPHMINSFNFGVEFKF